MNAVLQTDQADAATVTAWESPRDGGFWAGALRSSPRMLVAMAFGIACLLVAAVVIAQDAGKGDRGQIDSQLQQGQAYVDRMRAMVNAGFAEREEARTSQNVSRVNCVSEALGMMKNLLRLAEGLQVAMQECASRKEASCTDHEYQKISIAFNKCEELEGQLKGCGGPAVDGAIDGKPVVEKTVDPEMPDINPTSGLSDLLPKLELVPSASPFFKAG
jgi:hypothetical protein